MARRQASRRARKNSKESVRLALMRGLVRGLVLHGKIKTTESRAKALKPFVDKLVTRARSHNNDFARSLISARLGNDRDVVKRLFAYVSGLSSRTSGFTRIIRHEERLGDNAKMATIEWVEKKMALTKAEEVKSIPTDEKKAIPARIIPKEEKEKKKSI